MNVDNKLYFFNRLNSSLTHDLIFKNVYLYLLSFEDFNI